MSSTQHTAGQRERFVAWSVAGLVGVFLAGLAFLILLAVAASTWEPLQEADQAIVGSVNAFVHDKPVLVTALKALTDLGGSQAVWILLPVAVVWLLIRRRLDLALYVAVTGAGSGILANATKEVIERVRPVVADPVLLPPGHSFPSGHTMAVTTTYGVLLLTFLPIIPRRWRRLVIGAVVAVIAVVGLTRVGLGAHYPSDVLGGWVMGSLWLFVTATAFRRWEEPEVVRHLPWAAGLAPEERPALEMAPHHDRVLPDGWHTASRLLVIAVAIWGVMIGIGLLITSTPVIMEVDHTVAEWFASHRTAFLSDLVFWVGHLGSTLVIVGILMACVPLAAALTRRWTPAIFLLLATACETLFFVAVAYVIERPRPSVERLVENVPPTASFPSGHVAATVVTYGGISLLLLAWTRTPWRYLTPVLAILASLGVAWARMYMGVHYLTDVLASVFYASVWLWALWHFLEPWRGSPADTRRDEEVAPRETEADAESDAGPESVGYGARGSRGEWGDRPW